MNIAAVLAGHKDPNATALIHDAGTESYGDLIAAVSAVHAGLAELGVGPGDRVAILAGTTPAFVKALFGTLSAGAVAVPLNPLSPATEMQDELETVRPTVVFVGPAAASACTECGPACDVVALPGAEIDGAIPFDLFVGDDRPPMVDSDDHDLALLLYTSGTAGAPKPAMLTHGNLLANIAQLDALGTPLVGPDDVMLGAVPLFHILGLNLLLGVTLRAGATIVLMHRFDAATAIELIEKHGVSVVTGPPTLWQALADLPGVDPASFDGIRHAVSGAAPLSADVATKVEERLGIRLRQGYGLTEAAPILTVSTGTSAPATSVGRPVPGVQLRLVDTRGHDVPVGDEGEVWAKGPNVFAGYLDDPEATDAVLDPDGWLHTGDLGVVDDEGFLYIVNRSKDLIVVSGFNVYPGEVEAVLNRHPAIAGSAVVGIAHPSSGEAVKAVVVARQGAVIDPDQVIAHCAADLARYKCPSVVEVVAELPTGTSGKLRRAELREPGVA